MIQIAQLVAETGAASCVGFLLGLSFAHQYRVLVAQRGSDAIGALYWPMVRQSFWLSQCLGWCFVAWLFLEGSAHVNMMAAAVGLLAGIARGLARRDLSGEIRAPLVLGLILCVTDWSLEFVANDFAGRLVGPPLMWGVLIAGAVGVIAVAFRLLLRLAGRESRAWSFRIPALGSLLLSSGGPFLWLVMAASVGFGFSCSTRCVRSSSTATSGRLFAFGLGSVALGHALFYFYFYEMSSYGIFWHPVVAVAPYALGGILIGFFCYRVGIVDTVGRANEMVA